MQKFTARQAFCVCLLLLRFSLVSAQQTTDRLRDDDPEYNPKYSLLVPALEVPLTNGLLWGFNRYVTDEPFARISIDSVKNNFRNGWTWDHDDFTTNFSLHPYLGSAYFNCARANGYTFYESIPFVVGGSLMWELFMENTRPSYNDMVNTTVSGIFLGEVLYRLSSNLLNDRSTGPKRFFRELGAFILNPARGVNRLQQGNMFRVLDKEVYQKEPLRFTFAVGARRTGGLDIGQLVSGDNAIINLNFLYGDPFEFRPRKPYDYFTLRMEFRSGQINDAITNVEGAAFLFGRTAELSERAGMMIAAFQHYDYWNTDTFEIGTLGFGAGLFSKIIPLKNGYFHNTVHVAAVPLAGSNARKIASDGLNPGFRNYTFSAGAQFKYATELNLRVVSASADYHLYWLHTILGKPGDDLIHIIRPKMSVRFFRNLHLAYEYLFYRRKDSNAQGPTIRVNSNEQRLYILAAF